VGALQFWAMENLLVAAFRLIKEWPRKYLVYLAADDNSQVNACFSWRFLKTAKETHHFIGGSWKQPRKPSFSWRFVKTAKLIHPLLDGLHKQPRKPTFSLAVYNNSQGITFSWRFSATAKETLYSLAAQF